MSVYAFRVSLIAPRQPRPAKTAAPEQVAVSAKRPKRLLGIGGDTFESLSIPDYRWLWMSSLGSFMGMNMQMVARVWLVLKLTDDSPLAISLVTMSFALPMMFVSVIAGALADRVPRRRMMIVAQAANAVVTLIVATLDLTGVVAFWHIMVAGLVNGSLMALNMPSRQVLVSEIVPEDRLMNGIALQNSAMNVTRIFGPAAAGFLIIYIDTSGVFYLVAAIYVATVLLVVPMNVGREVSSRSGRGMTGDVEAGFRYAIGDPVLRSLILMAFIPVLFGYSYYVLMPAWAREALNVGSEDLGMLMMTMGFGALAGSLLVAGLKMSSSRGLILLACCLLWGLGLAAFARTTSYAFALPLLLFVGLASSMFMSLNMTLLQMHAAPEMRGRVMSIAMMTFGVMPLSAAPFGILAERTGSTPDALMLSGLMLVGLTVIFGIASPTFRRIK